MSPRNAFVLGLVLSAWACLTQAASTDLTDLPLIEVPATSPATEQPLAMLLTGDGGWASIDRTVSAALAAKGMPVIGFNTLRYFWKARTPEESARDVARTLVHYQQAWSRQGIVLIGYSQGADVLPFIVNRLPSELRSQIRVITLISLSTTVEFEFRLTNLLPGTNNSGRPIAPELARLDLSKVICLYGADDADTLCPSLQTTSAEVVQVGSGHHLGGKYDVISDRILAASGVTAQLKR